MFVQALSLTVGLYVVSFVKSWRLTLVASASLPFILVVYGTIIPFFLKNHAATMRHFEKASSLAFELMSSIRIVVAFGAEGRLTSTYDKFIDDARKSEMKNAPLMGLLMSPVLFSTYGTFALGKSNPWQRQSCWIIPLILSRAFWYGVKLVTNGQISGIGAITVSVIISFTLSGLLS